MEQSNAEQNKVIRDLKAGKYRQSYLVYNRKSTDDLDNQKNSISYQKVENVKFAQRELLPIAGVTLTGFCTDGIISEKHSGFKESDEMVFGDGGLVQYRIDRPKFSKLVHFLNEGYFRGFLVLCWDRVSRNKSDASIVRKLMARGVDVRFVHASYDKTSAGELHMDIDGMFAEHHSRVTSEKVSLTIRNLREKGVCTHRAPVGYLNNGNMYDKPFDSVRAPLIRKMFELYATGMWCLADLARWSNDNGLTMPPMRARRTEKEILAEDTDESLLARPISRPLTYTVVQKILTNPFYAGKTMGNGGKYVPSVSHKPLVTQELFDSVQVELNRKKVSAYYEEKLEHPYRGLIRCGMCERIYTPYIQKGTMYYRCRCRQGCENELKNFNMTFIDAKLGELLAGLVFTADELAEIDSRAETDIVLFEEKRISDIEQSDRKKKKLREDMSYLRTNKLILLRSLVYTPEDYISEEARITEELNKIQEEEQASDIAMHEVMKEVIKISELLKDTKLYYENAKPDEKESIIRTIFSELTISENTLKYKCRNGFKAFESRMYPNCDLIGWLSELGKYYSDMQSSARALSMLIK